MFHLRNHNFGINFGTIGCPFCKAENVTCNDEKDQAFFSHNALAESWANMTMVDCPNAEHCDIKKMARGNLKEHLEKFCPGRLITCSSVKYHCTWKGRVGELEQHETNECPFRDPLVKQALKELEERLTNVMEESQALKKKLEELEKQPEANAPSEAVVQDNDSTMRNAVPSAPPQSVPSILSFSNPTSSFMYGSNMMSSSYSPYPTTTSNYSYGQQALHSNVTCSVCQRTNFSGIAYKCCHCNPDYHVCQDCFNRGFGSRPVGYHTPSHTLFYPIRRVSAKIINSVWTVPNSVPMYIDQTSFEFNLNEQTGEICPMVAFGSSQGVYCKGTWRNNDLNACIVWSSTGRSITIMGKLSTLPSSSTATLKLSFMAPAPGYGQGFLDLSIATS